ncbi:MAG: tetratricopeptide repeat protein [Bacteroidota bacterium]
MMRIVGLYFIIIFLPICTQAQNDFKSKLDQAQGLENQNKPLEALIIYKDIIKSDSSQSYALCKTAAIMAKEGPFIKTIKNKEQWYRQALYLAEKGTRLNPKLAEAHFTVAFSCARLTDYSSINEKVNLSIKMKTEAEKAIALKPTLAEAYFILGKWHQVMASFNSFERMMIHAIYNNMPEGSYQLSIDYLNKAISNSKSSTLLYQYELANTYYLRDEDGDEDKARAILIKIEKTIPKSEEEKGVVAQIKSLKNKLD